MTPRRSLAQRVRATTDKQAAEIARLRTINTQLLEALKVLREHCDYPDPAGARLADAAIVAAEG